MTNERFMAIVKLRFDDATKRLTKKSVEYDGGSSDRFHNFKKGVIMSGDLQMNPLKVLKGFELKHRISIDDMIMGKTEITRNMIHEKIGDAVCYAVLLEGLMIESLEDKEDGLTF